jgi:hypothetical protein
MIEEKGKITRAFFSARHTEGVAQIGMDTAPGWEIPLHL